MSTVRAYALVIVLAVWIVLLPVWGERLEFQMVAGAALVTAVWLHVHEERRRWHG